MKIEGVKKLLRQLDDLPEEVQRKLSASVKRTTKMGEAKARAFAPDVTGDFKSGINSNFIQEDGNSIGFINFYDGDADDGLAANAINYGWGNLRYGFEVRRTVISIIGPRHARSVSRHIKKAIQEALNG